ncbi:MAG: crossover junction endodeoxyribonuclease RuvC, partial [Dehalococcoidia bacterium]|nr:crossover junction endodeoxyribonuclease RuvC [Dehalococcoidia bacterium]
MLRHESWVSGGDVIIAVRQGMRIIGIDPGTVHLGYGIIETDGRGMKMVACGSVNVSARMAVEKRLVGLHRELVKVIARYRPDEVAVEEPFVHENVRTALAIGRAEAVSLLAAASRDLPVFRYPPALVKQRVTGSGGAGKGQVRQVVQLLLGLKSPPETTDAS